MSPLLDETIELLNRLSFPGREINAIRNKDEKSIPISANDVLAVRALLTRLNDAAPLVTKGLNLLGSIARMETEEEIYAKDGEGISGDDAVDTVSCIIEEARDLLGVRS